MHSKLTQGAVAVAGLSLAAGVLATAPAASAAPTSVTQVRPTDLILIPGTISGTTGTAKADFLAEGIHIKTDNATDAARAYYAIPGGVPLAEVHTVDYEWFGTPAAQPAMAYNIDIDGDNKPDAQLLGEAAYGGKDVWLNRDSQDFTGVTPTVPAGFFAGRSPCSPTNTPQNGNLDGCVGSGDPRHGTLDDWVRSLAAVGKTAKVVSSGYIAVGLVYNGVLRSQTVGSRQFTFTNQAKGKVVVSLKARHEKVKKSQKIRFSGSVSPTAPGAKVTLEVKKGGKWATVKSRVLGAAGQFRFGAKPERLGKNRYRVTVAETNSTQAAKSRTVKVLVTRR
jgi:hypothetical protein